MNALVDRFFAKEGPWKECYALLRELALGSGLVEELKWGHPCYTLKGKNVVLMHGFKEYCALLFHKGALLNNDHGSLVRQTANVQSARQVRFTSARQIMEMTPLLRSIINEAIDNEKTGRKVTLKQTGEFEVPEEFATKLRSMPVLRKAFHALSPGRQRGYLLYFSSARKSATRAARVEKHMERIMAGKGLDD